MVVNPFATPNPSGAAAHATGGKEGAVDDEREQEAVRDPIPDCYRGGVWGTRLRHAALAVLILQRGEPISVPQIMDRIRKRHVVRVGVTRKDLADALRHEVRLGRAVRAFHGHYVVGTIAPRTRRRILRHDRQLLASDRRARGHWAMDALGRGTPYRRPTGARGAVNRG